MNRKLKDGRADDVMMDSGHEMPVEHGNNDILNDLLEKTRQVGRALQNRRDGDSLDYIKLAKLLSEFLTAAVYILGKEGKILGSAWVSEYNSPVLSNFVKEGYMPEEFVAKINRYRESEINDADVYLFDDNNDSNNSNNSNDNNENNDNRKKKTLEKHLMYIPIYGAAAERLGTVVLVNSQRCFVTQDILLAEYLGTLVGIEMLNDRNRSVEEVSRDRIAVQMAMRALSYSEAESMKHIMAELDGHEGVAVASKVADRVGVTRSVIVNALRKLESAGLIESRSLGMKGTYIKILSPLFIEELGSATSPRVHY